MVSTVCGWRGQVYTGLSPWGCTDKAAAGPVDRDATKVWVCAAVGRAEPGCNSGSDEAMGPALILGETSGEILEPLSDKITEHGWLLGCSIVG